ncbi:hypothetical protein B0H14DRAFT_2626215 [Mycena olivaceomarginata]|nr:hypothetical protein B0H14DRAFT_2626215 [Mycena olivaceomarginata]
MFVHTKHVALAVISLLCSLTTTFPSYYEVGPRAVQEITKSDEIRWDRSTACTEDSREFEMMDLRYDSSLTVKIEDPRPAGPRRNSASKLDSTLSVHPVDLVSAVDQPDVEEKVVASGPQDETATTIGQELRSHQPATHTPILAKRAIPPKAHETIIRRSKGRDVGVLREGQIEAYDALDAGWDESEEKRVGDKGELNVVWIIEKSSKSMTRRLRWSNLASACGAAIVAKRMVSTSDLSMFASKKRFCTAWWTNPGVCSELRGQARQKGRRKSKWMPSGLTIPTDEARDSGRMGESGELEDGAFKLRRKCRKWIGQHRAVLNEENHAVGNGNSSPSGGEADSSATFPRSAELVEFE